MSITGIILAVLLAAAGAAVTLLPWLAREEDLAPAGGHLRGTDRQNRAYETLWAEKMRVLRALRDLDFDFDTGKIAPEMYIAQREGLVRLGVAIMQRLDALEEEIAAQHARIDDAVAEFRRRLDRTRS